MVILFLVLWGTAILGQFIFAPAVHNGSSFSTFSYAFSRSFVISGFTLRSMIYFESIYITMWGMVEVHFFFFWHVDVWLFQYHLLKTVIFSPLNCFCTFVKIHWHIRTGLLLGPYSSPLISVSVLSPISHFFDNCGCIVSCKIRQYESYNLALPL